MKYYDSSIGAMKIIVTGDIIPVSIPEHVKATAIGVCSWQDIGDIGELLIEMAAMWQWPYGENPGNGNDDR